MKDLKKLKKLKSEWYLKLKQSGFEDQEDAHGRLKQYNRRTIAFDNRDKIREFFLSLDNYLITENLNPLHRKILQLYTEGVYLKEISRRVKKSYATIKNIINQHKKKIISHFAQE